MRRRLFVAGIGMLALGAYLLLVPIASGPVTALYVPSNRWAQISVPWSESIFGGEVSVELSYGVPPAWCLGYCPERYVPAGPVSVDVFDCGASSCVDGRDYSYVGSMGVSSVGVAYFNAASGHDYQLWARSASDASMNFTIPLRYSIHGPVLGGVPGAVGLSVGAAAVLTSISRLRHSRSSLTDLQRGP